MTTALVLWAYGSRSRIYHRPLEFAPMREERRIGLSACGGYPGATFREDDCQREGLRPCRRCWPVTKRNGT